ncbi:MAG: hypothetical protein V2A73_01375, partial [Pseudomonadota bacterium]
GTRNQELEQPPRYGSHLNRRPESRIKSIGWPPSIEQSPSTLRDTPLFSTGILAKVLTVARVGTRAGMVVGAVVGILGGCGRQADSPEAAFDALQVVAMAKDCQALYLLLDTESRWALDSVWKNQREIAKTVESFPPELRQRHLSRVAVARDSSTASMFLCRQTVVPEPFRILAGPTGLGVRKEIIRNDPRQATVMTNSGLAVPMFLGPEGHWGWAGLREALFRWRDVTANDLARIQADARLYSSVNNSIGDSNANSTSIGLGLGFDANQVDAAAADAVGAAQP